MERPTIASRHDWLAARKKLLAAEKELTRLRDQVSAQRRSLPWVRIDKPYLFDGPDGRESLAELFEGRSQLIVQHFMFGPGWKEGCPGCSFLADHLDGALPHLAARDVTFVAISRAPFAKIRPFHRRMGWRFRWMSSYGSDFNYDFHVSSTPEERLKGSMRYNYGELEFADEELPGTSVFCRDANGEVFHTYSTYARGEDMLLGTYNFLDLTPKGRDEEGLAYTMSWVRHHDRYREARAVETAAA